MAPWPHRPGGGLWGRLRPEDGVRIRGRVGDGVMIRDGVRIRGRVKVSRVKVSH